MKNLDKKHKVIVFYDSFLISTMYLYLKMFAEVYLIKDMYNVKLIEKLKVDFVFEFRVERFLR
jgi:hypothetical protein